MQCEMYFAPYKQKTIRYNNNLLMTNTFQNKISLRWKLRNKFNKFRVNCKLAKLQKGGINW